jgi:hypothetical protein
MKKKYQVFVSSTFTDLKFERQSAVESILRAGHIPAGMELFSAGNESQLEIIKRWIEDSDIYMLLLGGRYGSLETKSKLSYTEIEYRYALELEKPVFALIMDESLLNKKVKTEGKDVLELLLPENYKNFKELVMSKVCRYFKDTTEIKLGVMESLLDIQSRLNIHGWIRSNEVPDVNGLVKEIDDLREKNKQLLDSTKKIEDLKPSRTPGKAKTENNSDFSYEELKEILSKEIITIPASVTTTGKSGKMSLLDTFIVNMAHFALGVINNPHTTDEGIKFYQKSVIPTLLAFGLVEKVKFSGSSYDRFQTSKIGNNFLALYKIEKVKKK